MRLKKELWLSRIMLDFSFLETKNYHSSFHLWEDFEKDYMLTDLVEIHFIELPKFRSLKNKNYKDEALQRWLTFLEKDISKEVLEELMQMEPAIKMAEDKLDFLSSDPETIELYRAREYSAHERANMISSAEQRGEQRGEKRGEKRGEQRGRIQEKIDIARALLDILDDEMIATKTGLELQEVKKLRSENDR